MNQKSSKGEVIIYWISTLWLALGMISTAIVQHMRMKEEVDKTSLQLGYPIYFLTIIGVWKILGTIVILFPGFKLVKEWAYAGFVFLLTGAIVSHLVNSNGGVELFGPSLLLMLTFISWRFRPMSRKLNFK